MIYAIESILSVILIGCTAFISYRLFNWSFATNKILFVNLVYLVWFVIAFLLAFTNGAAINKFIEIQKGREIFSNIVSIIWVVSILGITIYVWFKRPYTVGSVITRAIWSYPSLGLAVWIYIMINLMQSSRQIKNKIKHPENFNFGVFLNDFYL